MKANMPYFIYKLSNWCWKKKIPFIPIILKGVLRFVCGAVIPPETQIGKNVHFGYNGLGIVLHRRAIIGDNVHIFPHVVIGGNGGYEVPVIKDQAILGAGAKILGNVTVGERAKVGANAVVLCDVPDDTTAVGVPAKIIKKKYKKVIGTFSESSK